MFLKKKWEGAEFLKSLTIETKAEESTSPLEMVDWNMETMMNRHGVDIQSTGRRGARFHPNMRRICPFVCREPCC